MTQEQENFNKEIIGKLESLCRTVIERVVSEESYEDAARIRDARNALANAITRAVENFLPF